LKDNSAAILTEIWNKLLLSKSIEVCTEFIFSMTQKAAGFGCFFMWKILLTILYDICLFD
jgi:hypothetical protein